MKTICLLTFLSFLFPASALAGDLSLELREKFLTSAAPLCGTLSRLQEVEEPQAFVKDTEGLIRTLVVHCDSITSYREKRQVATFTQIVFAYFPMSFHGLMEGVSTRAQVEDLESAFVLAQALSLRMGMQPELVEPLNRIANQIAEQGTRFDFRSPIR